MSNLRGAALARKTLTHIEQLEERRINGEQLGEWWNQDEWGQYIGPEFAERWDRACGTAMCFAGWACKLAGDELVAEDNGYGLSHLHVQVDGKRQTIATRAAELLGLPDRSYGPDERIFSGGLSLDDLRFYVEAMEDGTYGDAYAPGADPE